MAHAILMPQAGQSMTEGKIVEWFVSEGDSVGRGDPLLCIETDKANMDVESPGAGVLRKIYHAAGETVDVLEVVGVIAGADEDVDFEAFRKEESKAGAASDPAPAPAARAPAPKPKAAAKAAPGAAPAPSATQRPVASQAMSPTAVAAPLRPRVPSGPLRCSPLARRLARIRGIDLAGLVGSGPQGRVIRRDVEAAARSGGAAIGVAGAGPAGSSIAPASAAIPYPSPSPRPEPVAPIEGMRKAIASALQQSKVQAPHFYLSVEIDVSAVLELRAGLVASGTKVSVNDLVVRAVALALVDEPRVNCRVFNDRVEYPESVNVGVAVGLDEGLVVPVILDAQDRGIADIAEETRRIIDAARGGRLVGMGQGTFTISNLGMFGVDSFTAVINPPEGAILAVGAATPRLVPMAGGFFQRTIMKATLSADHRAIDGVLAAKFMGRVRHLLESPDRLAAS